MERKYFEVYYNSSSLRFTPINIVLPPQKNEKIFSATEKVYAHKEREV